MTALRQHLISSIQRQHPFPKETIAVAFSAGLDSLTTALSATAAGRKVRLYIVELAGLRSRETAKASAIARHFGWQLDIVTVPLTSVAGDFYRLITEDLCTTKVQGEVCYLCRYLFSAIRERCVLMSMNADEHYGNTRKVILEQLYLKRDGISEADRKARFDATRGQQLAKAKDLASGDTWGFAVRAASRHGKVLIDPYLDEEVASFFQQFGHDELSARKKPVVRQAFAKELDTLDPSLLACGIGMQGGARVAERLADLLQDPRVNRYDPPARTTLTLFQRHAKAFMSDEATYASGIGFPPPEAAAIRPSIQHYEPYLMSTVRDRSQRGLFNVISTFAGGGGSSIGYRLAGGKVVAVSEFVPEAARTYARNFPDVAIDKRNIRELLRNGIETLLASAKIASGEIDIVDGSPPCSQFSIAGNGIGDQDILKKYSDVTQSGIATLPFAFADFVHAARPRVFVMENVPNLASAKTHELLQSILEYLKKSPSGNGYFANFSALYASDYGVAQRRARLFIIGVRRDVGNRVGIESDADILSLYPSPTHGLVSIRSALSGLPQKAREVDPWFAAARESSIYSLVRSLPKEPRKHTRLPHAHSHFTLTRCSWDLPAPTLVVMGQQPNGLSGAHHPRYDRKFTIPELKRLFALPDDYALTGSLSQGAERICRMVPPLLTRVIAESIYERVLKPYREACDAGK